jgi:hypothetical protein
MGRWNNPADKETAVRWVKALRDSLTGLSKASVLQNSYPQINPHGVVATVSARIQVAWQAFETPQQNFP